MVGMIGLWFLFYFSGVVAYAVYHDCDPLKAGLIEKPDQILPFLVMDKLGHLTGLPGLFVSAVYGGVLSSLSTTGNAIACLVWEDILLPWPYFARMSNTASSAVCKIVSAVAGVSGIFLGMLAGQLGNVFHVTISVSGSIMGPMQGIFVAGICVPWVNTKGVVIGFLTAISYNLWIVVGKFYRGGGSPQMLPLSMKGCPENILNFVNSTIINSTSELDFTIGPTAALPEESYSNQTTAYGQTNEEEEKSMYDVSYCFFGIGGIVITVIVSSIVSICTGPHRPQDVDPRLVNPTCARLYIWLWGMFCSSKNKPGHTDIPYEESSVAMLPTNAVKLSSLPGGKKPR
ncbi:sodium-coupled monocarboxylate transporter 1-like [Eriocheir sinensis]|nr:sodium-coupled monocarboxylate transporter 1-like [Eriocheir sinensis]